MRNLDILDDPFTTNIFKNGYKLTISKAPPLSLNTPFIRYLEVLQPKITEAINNQGSSRDTAARCPNSRLIFADLLDLQEELKMKSFA